MKILDFKKLLRYFGKGSGWKIIVASFLVLPPSMVIINYYAYLNIEKKIARPLDTEVEIKVLKRELLTMVLNDLQEKEKRIEQLLLSKPDVSDPSL